MLFAIDIGNSHTVVGLYDETVLKAQWRLTSDRAMTPDEIAIKFNALFTMSGLVEFAITDIIIASVVPSLEAAWLSCCEKHFSAHLQAPPLIVNNQTLENLISIKIDYPSEVGADRLVNSLAGWAQYKSDMIVIDFGTAITFDCVTAECEYVGGAIVPGVAISLEALARKTAKLPLIDISTPPVASIGKNTVDAMKSGILHGYGAMIDGLLKILGRELSNEPDSLNFMATGGMANLIIPYSQMVSEVDQLLTLKGLQYIHQTTRGLTI